MAIQQYYPNSRPSLNLNFALSTKLDPVVTFSRTTSGTQINRNGFIESVPADTARFDHDPETLEPRGLLVEEGRTNRCTQSSNFNFSSTNNVTETNVLNPDGTPAIRRVPLSSGNFHGTGADATDVNISSQAVGGTTDLTTSIFVRNYNNSNLRLLIGFVAIDDDAGPAYRYLLGTINTATPTVLPTPSATGWSNGSTKVEDYGNGWYRYTFSGRYTKEAGYDRIAFVGEQIFSSTDQQFWNGDDVSGIYVWGKQRELGLFSTSYIPTAGSEGIRGTDNVTIEGDNFSSFYNPSEWTLMVTARRNYSGNFISYPNLLRMNDGTLNNNVAFYGAQGSTQLTNYSINSGGVNQTDYVLRFLPDTSQFKMIQALKINDSTFGVNGTLTTTDTTVTMPTGINRMFIGSDGSGQFWGGTIQQIVYYPSALSNAILQTLTK